MSHPYHHALSSVKRYGGRLEDYLPLHEFLDCSKAHFADIRHRSVLHNTFGITLAERVFGPTLNLGEQRTIPIRVIAERHILEDLGQIPTLADWLRHLPITPWMRRTTPHMRECRAPDVGSRMVSSSPSEKFDAIRS